MNYLRLLALYEKKVMDKAGRGYLFPEEAAECAKKAKRLNTWMYMRHKKG
jgi:hypothetical protein